MLRPVTQVEVYVQLLYALLRRIDRCFFSGAFVIADDQQRLFNLLLSARSRERLPARSARFGTHRSFMNDQDCDDWMYNRDRCGKQFEIDLSELNLMCEAGSHGSDRRNVLLFYGFIGADLRQESTQAKEFYVFMKLETSSYASLRHAFSAARFYGSRALSRGSGDDERAEAKAKRRAVRREKLGKNGAVQLQSADDYGPFECAQVRRDAQRYDRLLRKGNEFFVPQLINSAILRTVARSLPTKWPPTLDQCLF